MLKSPLSKNGGMQRDNFIGKAKQAVKALLAVQPLEGYDFSEESNDE
jgi:hypothetical protein